MNQDLFSLDASGPVSLGPQSWLLPGFAAAEAEAVWRAILAVLDEAPLRGMITPGGRPMSVQTSSCGQVGWVSDRRGYRYAAQDPLSGKPWPAMPGILDTLARTAAQEAGFPAFRPDACLINRYLPGARMGLHQDRDERDFTAPIVSLSLGLPAVFLFGGAQRSDKAKRVPLRHGDVLVWGGVDRLRFHGILPVAPGCHPLLGEQRVNLTWRQAVS